MDDHLPYTRPVLDIVHVDHAIDTSWGRGKHKGAGRRMRLGFHRATTACRASSSRVSYRPDAPLGGRAETLLSRAATRYTSSEVFFFRQQGIRRL